MVAQRTLIARALALLALVFAPLATADEFLWEETSLTSKVYLFGTVHAGKRDWYPLPQAVEKAFADSDVLVVEADITDEKAIRMSTDALTYKAPDQLKNHVPPEQYARLVKLLPRYRFLESDVAPAKPFMAVSLLVFAEWARSGFQPAQGVDNYLIRKAHAEAKPIVEIQGAAAQIALMDALTDQQAQEPFNDN